MAKTHTQDKAGGAGPHISFEFFPPRSVEAEQQLARTLDRLLTLQPSFSSVTYGAGGSDRDRTVSTLMRISRRYGATTAGHLTCLGASRHESDQMIETYRRIGVRHILALRGDDPREAGSGADSTEEGYQTARNLVAAIRARFDAKISVAAYPDGHPKSASPQAEFANLVAKFDAGADQAITQFFFSNQAFLDLRERLARAGIDKPLVAGILPIADFAQVRRFAKRCGTPIPEWIHHAFANAGRDREMQRLVAISIASEQVRLLMREGVEHFHFYTLNRADPTLSVCQTLGIRPDLKVERLEGSGQAAKSA